MVATQITSLRAARSVLAAAFVVALCASGGTQAAEVDAQRLLNADKASRATG